MRINGTPSKHTESEHCVRTTNFNALADGADCGGYRLLAKATAALSYYKAYFTTSGVKKQIKGEQYLPLNFPVISGSLAVFPRKGLGRYAIGYQNFVRVAVKQNCSKKRIW